MRESRLGIAEDGKAERRYGIRKIKELTESLFPFGDGVDATPEPEASSLARAASNRFSIAAEQSCTQYLP